MELERRHASAKSREKQRKPADAVELPIEVVKNSDEKMNGEVECEVRRYHLDT